MAFSEDELPEELPVRNAVTTSADDDEDELLAAPVLRTRREADDEKDDCPEPEPARTRPILDVAVEAPDPVSDAVLATVTTWLATEEETPDALPAVANIRTPTAETVLVAVAVPSPNVVRSVDDDELPVPVAEPVRSAFRTPENRRSDS